MPLLEVKDLVKRYGRRTVVNGINFDVNAGEIVGLLGPNGAGKTTSFRMTTGQISPHAGAVWFNDNDVTRLPMFRRARLGMGYLSQETSVFRKLTVEQNILAILEILPKARSLGRRLTRSERYTRTETVLEQFGLMRVRKNNASRLSGGEKRRLEIARCLVCEPLLILLDEPFTGIDPKTIADIQQIVLQLRERGIGILLTDHNVREALKITDRSYLIKDGRVRTHGTPKQILHDPVAINEYLGHGFHDDIFSRPSTGAAGKPRRVSIVTDKSKEVAVMEKAPKRKPKKPAAIREIIQKLKGPHARQAADELTAMGQSAVGPLLDALELRDVELRRQVHQVLQSIYQAPVAFDPYAPETMRRQQIRNLRERWQRKAG